MKHLTKHASQAALDAIKAQLAKPQVAVIVDNNGVLSGSIYYEKYVANVTPVTPSHDYSQDYFTLEAIDNCTFSFNCPSGGIQYSTDNGSTWSEEYGETQVSVSAGDKVLLKGSMTLGETGYDNNYNIITSNGYYNIEGNIFSLYYGDNFTGITDISNYNSCFYNFFEDDPYLVNAEHLSLSATTLADYCYRNMFRGCTSLTTAPELPATTLAQSCYQDMFYDCTSLTTAPELPATTLASGCYYQMFEGCTSLTTAPELPATTLAKECCYSMFNGCTSLTTAPELPATTLASNCYNGMFYGCTSLTTAPELPATTLANQCYYQMFRTCTSLTTVPELPATTLANQCYYKMFSGCTSLNYVKCLAINISASGCTSDWLSGVSATGTFVKADNMTSWTTGVSGIPSGWTVQDAA